MNELLMSELLVFNQLEPSKLLREGIAALEAQKEPTKPKKSISSKIRPKDRLEKHLEGVKRRIEERRR